MKYVWSARRPTTCRLCSTTHTVRPCSRTVSMRSSIVSTHLVSMPDAGSSSSSTSASVASTRASETSLVCPYDRAPAGTSANSAMPTKPSQSIAFVARLCLDARRPRRWANASVAKFSPGWSCTAIITFCRHDSRLNSRTSWNERTMPLRATCAGLSPTSSSPFSFTEPASGGMAPVRRLNTVVLPAPFGPTRAVIVPCRSSMCEVVGGDDAAEALARRRWSRARPARRATRRSRAVLLG